MPKGHMTNVPWFLNAEEGLCQRRPQHLSLDPTGKSTSGPSIPGPLCWPCKAAVNINCHRTLQNKEFRVDPWPNITRFGSGSNHLLDRNLEFPSPSNEITETTTAGARGACAGPRNSSLFTRRIQLNEPPFTRWSPNTPDAQSDPIYIYYIYGIMVPKQSHPSTCDPQLY